MPPKVVIAGAGLVGSLNACFFAKRGWQVEVYEARDDIRRMEHVPGRSINLALSKRGMAALESVGLRDYIVKKGVELHARLVHDIDGVTTHRQPYGQPGQFIVSINRRDLNETMIAEAEKYTGRVSFFFRHKVQRYLPPPPSEDSTNSRGGTLVVDRVLEGGSSEVVEVEGIDLLLACDGAYSALRRSLMSYPHIFQYSQNYIEHGYVELNIAPTPACDYALEPNVFHLWPRGSFTLIALANRDKTFTVTLFAPFTLFCQEELFSKENPDASWRFFSREFPDVAPLLGKQHVVGTFTKLQAALPLISVKCEPHAFFNNRLLLTGDAAHAMAFLTRGGHLGSFLWTRDECGLANIDGFEDCLVLDEILDKFNENIPKSVEYYSQQRCRDAHAISDLATYNYSELRDLVNKHGYKLRRRIDLWLNSAFPNLWTPLYSMVTFTRIPYHRAVEMKAWQDKMVNRFLWAAGFSASAIMIATAVLNYSKLAGYIGAMKPSLSR